MALQKFSQQHNAALQKCGLYVNPEWPFLGASPDGLILSEDALIEVKCPYVGRHEKVEPGKMFPFLEVRKNKIHLKKSHKYYCQIIGQMAISRKCQSYFVVYTQANMFIEKIKMDNEFWEKEMLPKLQYFYEKSYRPYVAKHL